MKKFKLIKEYPGSPNLGTICEERNNKSSFCYYFEGEKNIGITKDQVENQPEYWEEVIEKDYEITSYVAKDCYGIIVPGSQYPDSPCKLPKDYWKIHSVKRLSDGEVFTVGDLITGQSYTDARIIEKIKIRYNGSIELEQKHGDTKLVYATKAKKQPIFLTHDGKDIFTEDIVWYVNKENFYYDYIKVYPEVKFNSEIRAYFLTREAAEDYIERNKVLFTTEDGVEIKKDEIVYVVDGRLTSIDMISNFKPENYPTMKAFSTSKAAEDYLIENKYALSIKDFWEFVCWGGSNFAKSKRLKRLVKERLGIK
jgi:hypothetical protein